MKKILFLFAFFTAFISFGQEINWMTMNEALAAQKIQPKKIMVDVYTTWCGPCKMMDKNTFTNKKLIDFVNKNYYAVKFNAEGNEDVKYQDYNYTNPGYSESGKGRNSVHHFTSALKITGYPSLAFFTEKGTLIQPITGYRTPQQLEIFLKMIANDDYKAITTDEAWENYQKKFKGTF